MASTTVSLTGASAPTLTLTTHALPQRIVRRRLAPNVVCMFQEERPAVVNERRRGRYPRNVVSFRSRPRLCAGDMAELCGGALPSNHGKKVRILQRTQGQNLPAGDWWDVESVWAPLDTRDVGRSQPDSQSMTAIVRDSYLRRVSNRTM